jgi:hypothetical protein
MNLLLFTSILLFNYIFAFPDYDRLSLGATASLAVIQARRARLGLNSGQDAMTGLKQEFSAMQVPLGSVFDLVQWESRDFHFVIDNGMEPELVSSSIELVKNATRIIAWIPLSPLATVKASLIRTQGKVHMFRKGASPMEFVNNFSS